MQNNSKLAAGDVIRDFRVHPLRSQIIKLTKRTVQEYDEMCSVQKPSTDLQTYVITNGVVARSSLNFFSVGNIFS